LPREVKSEICTEKMKYQWHEFLVNLLDQRVKKKPVSFVWPVLIMLLSFMILTLNFASCRF
jgi:hypothetical protein